MTEKPAAEELKKICLICGCHTNQAINIYEPRNGPNIVELIQAKFKFQPVNEDKYLCYSCNNWLINWHSLQNLNQDSQSRSGKSSGRSRINDAIPEEDDGSGVSEGGETHNNDTPSKNKRSPSKRNGFYFSKRFMLGCRRLRNHPICRTIENCSFCGKTVVKPWRSPCNASRKKIMKSRGVTIKCRNCKRILRWRAKYSKALIKEQNRKLKQVMTKEFETSREFYFKTNLGNRLRLQRPLIDGKVVAMLTRLGTTLTRESDCRLLGLPILTESINDHHRAGSERGNEDEILIDFNTVITEVLPLKTFNEYRVSSSKGECWTAATEIAKKSDHTELPEISLESIYSKIPKCVTVSVINSTSSDVEKEPCTAVCHD